MTVENKPVPPTAKDQVKCSAGGNHIPTTREGMANGTHIKYKVCTKCSYLLK